MVWCLSPDRVARSYAYQILILEELAGHAVPVRFADASPLDDPQGRLLVQIQGVIAEHERAKTRRAGSKQSASRVREIAGRSKGGLGRAATHGETEHPP
jgi:site-specific DNA recombinase